MFCSECGAKNEKKNDFCSECGAPLEKENTTVANTVKTRQPISKKNKMILTCIVIIAVLLGIGYKVVSDMTNPKTVAKEYIQAVIDQNGNKLYQYLDIEGDTTFITKKIFSELVLEEEKVDIVNYKITSIDYGEGKLSAKVNFTYTVKGTSEEETSYVNLTKQKNKKYFFFDDWRVSDFSNSSNIVKDYTIKVTKGSTVTFAGVKLTDKYLDKKQSTSKIDVYVLPQVFAYKTIIETILPNGMPIEENVNPSSYYSTHTVSFDEDSLTEAAKDKIISAAKDNFTVIYKNAIARNNFDSIKGKFEHNGIDLTDFRQKYTRLVSTLESKTRTLTSMDITDVSIYNLELNDDGYLEARFLVEYDYTVQYTYWYDEEIVTSDDSDYSYMKMILTYDNNEYYLVSVDNLETSF